MRVPSAQGQAEAERCVAAFAGELLQEASRVAGRHAAETASADHVAEAAAHLYSSGASRTNQVMATGGGILFGAASSALVTFLLSQPINAIGVGISTVASLLGVVAATAGVVRHG